MVYFAARKEKNMVRKIKNVMLTSIMMLVAVVLFACTPQTYTITFDTQGGSTVESMTLEEGVSITLPDDPERDGYTFEGWYVDSDLSKTLSTDYLVDAEITLYAKWEAITYTVTFETNGGSSVNAQVINENDVASEPTPTMDHNTFEGWYIDDELTTAYDFTTPITADVTLYAAWSEKVYTLTYETGAGSNVASVSGVFGTAITEPDSPTQTGYTFGGWFVEDTYETAFDFDETLAADVTLYAKWIAKEYTITFETSGGSTIDTMTVPFGETIDIPADPTLEGATFDGWYTSQSYYTAYTFTTMPARNVVVYAKWDMPDEDRVTSDLSSVNIPDVITGDIDISPYGEKGSHFSWSFSRPDVMSEDGEVVLAPIGSGGMPFEITLNASYGSYYETIVYNVLIDEMMENVVTSVENYEFIPLSTEYLVASSNIDLFFMNYGTVPYVDIAEFLPMIDGAIESIENDEPNEIIDEFGDVWHVVSYMEVIPQGGGVIIVRASSVYTPMVYEVEGEDPIVDTEREAETNTYEAKFDFAENTYYSESYDFFDSLGAATSTDFGDGLVFGDTTVVEGNPIEIPFNDYRIDLVEYDNSGETEYLMPLYLANLIFVGETYYDVYFNGDAVYGVDSYQLLDYETDIINEIRTSSMNNETAPLDIKLATYDYLALVFDYFYGLKEDKGFISAYDQFLPFSEDLLFGRDSSHYNAIFDLVYSLDDLHTYHTMTGYYTEPDYTIDLTSITQLGLRSASYYQSSWDVEDLIEENDRQTVSYTPDGKTAVVVIDSFTVDTPTEFEKQLSVISETNPDVDNVVIDLTNNGGGNVGAVWRLFGYMTEDPFYYHSMNPLENSVYTYEISSDYVAYDFNWYILISPVTFSAANLTAAMAKEAGFATIIGVQSSGGASSISGKVLPTGDVFFMSSLNVIAVETESGFESVEYGVVPDYEYPGLSKLYNYEYLQTVIAEIESEASN